MKRGRVAETPSTGSPSVMLMGRMGVTRTMDRKAHWERVYTTKASNEVSWFQPEPAVSLRLLERAGLTAAT